MSVTMNVIRDEGKRIPIELARTLYGEIGVAIEKYSEHIYGAFWCGPMSV